MARIVQLTRRNEYSTIWIVSAPKLARAFETGEFVALRIAPGEAPVPLPVLAVDEEQGTLTIPIATGGKHVEHRLLDFEEGAELQLSGPIAIEEISAWGRHSDIPARSPAPFEEEDCDLGPLFRSSCGCSDPNHGH